MAFYELDSQPGTMSADLYERPHVIGIEAAQLDTLELSLNLKIAECKATGRVLAVSEIRATDGRFGEITWHATIIWCKKRQIETGIPIDEDDDEFSDGGPC